MFLSVESDILSQSKIDTIGHWLEESNKLGTYKLCWKSSTNKAGFKSGCNGKKDTITVVKVGYNTYYGGFTDLSWGGELKLLFFVYIRNAFTAQKLTLYRIMTLF